MLEWQLLEKGKGLGDARPATLRASKVLLGGSQGRSNKTLQRRITYPGTLKEKWAAWKMENKSKVISFVEQNVHPCANIL